MSNLTKLFWGVCLVFVCSTCLHAKEITLNEYFERMGIQSDEPENWELQKNGKMLVGTGGVMSLSSTARDWTEISVSFSVLKKGLEAMQVWVFKASNGNGFGFSMDGNDVSVYDLKKKSGGGGDLGGDSGMGGGDSGRVEYTEVRSVTLKPKQVIKVEVSLSRKGVLSVKVGGKKLHSASFRERPKSGGLDMSFRGEEIMILGLRVKGK